jgi:hypothetical protein
MFKSWKRDSRLISVLLNWLYISFLSLVYGLLAVTWKKSDDAAEVPVPGIVLVGLALIAILTGYLSLFIGIGLLANAIVIGLGLLLAWRRRAHLAPQWARLKNQWQEKKPIALAAMGVLLALKNAIGMDWYEHPVFHYDTGFYHAQAIRWIAQFGVVPGLGTLHPPLAYDSLWFLPNALFNFAFLLPNYPLHALNGFVVFWAFCFCISGLQEVVATQKLAVSHCFRLLMCLPLIELSHYIISPSTDEPAAVYILMALALACVCIEEKAKGRNIDGLQFSVAMLAFFAVGIKLSVLPILLIVAFFVWGRNLIAYALLGTVMLLPKILRSIILSGYVLYPLDVDLFNFDWKIPFDIVVREKQLIAIWSRSPGQISQTVLDKGFSGWLPAWITDFATMPVASCLLAATILLIGSSLFAFKKTTQILRQYAGVYLTALIGTAYWFCIAPYIRYGFGFLAALTILIAIPALTYLPISKALQLRLDGFVAAACTLAFFSTDVSRRLLGTGLVISHFYFAHTYWMFTGDRSRRSFLFQDRYADQPVLLFPLGKLQIYRPVTGDQCWDTQIPCTPILGSRIEGRGLSLKDGFRIVPGPVGPFDGMRVIQERIKTTPH